MILGLFSHNLISTVYLALPNHVFCTEKGDPAIYCFLDIAEDTFTESHV